MKYFISRIIDVKFNLEQNNVNSVQRSRLHVMAHVIFFRHSPVNNALSPSCADARETVKFRHSHVIHSRPMKHMKTGTLAIGI